MSGAAARATVIVPTHDHGPDLLGPAVESALRQTVQDVEVVVVGDGVPDATRTLMQRLGRQDPRVVFADHPKGPRNGEAYRHAAVLHARGGIICYLCDDDLYLPNHVETMESLLQSADFAHTLATRVEADGRVATWNVDLTRAAYRQMLLAGNNRLPLGAAAHTKEFYLRLPHGWRTTPFGIPTDLYMWQQILARQGCRVANAMVLTYLHFPASSRRGVSSADRAVELQTWARRVADPASRGLLDAEVLETLARDRALLEENATRYVRWGLAGILKSLAGRLVNRL